MANRIESFCLIYAQDTGRYFVLFAMCYAFNNIYQYLLNVTFIGKAFLCTRKINVTYFFQAIVERTGGNLI